MLQKAIEVLKGFEADKGASIEQVSASKFEKRLGSQKISKEDGPSGVSGNLECTFPQEKLQDVIAKLSSEGIEADLQVPLKLGVPFNDYGQIDNVLDEGKTVLKHQPGEVLLVDVWATWCPPCQKPMAHNQEMLEKYGAQWSGKARIVGVSVDQTKEAIKKRIEDKKWDKIIHLTLLGWKGEHSLIKDFRIQGIPFVCLVDKFGKINYVGHPSGINLEERIHQLINQESEVAAPQQNAAAPQQSASSSEEAVSKLIQSLTEQKLTELFSDVSLICFITNKKQKYDKGVYSASLIVKAFVLQGDEVGIEKVKALFSVPGVDLKIDTVKYVDIPNHENVCCWKCESNLSYPFYWLKWEEGDKFGCRKCVEEPSTVEGHHYAYLKNSVLLFGKWPSVAQKQLGHNIQPVDILKVDDRHQFCCNACGRGSKKVGEARYIDLGSRPQPNFARDYDDICQTCMEKIIAKDQHVITAYEAYNEAHPFLRVLYSVKGYYDF